MTSRVDSVILNHLMLWMHPKNQERNLVSAGFHMISITLISMSLVQLEWFQVIGGQCTPNLSLSQFFWFGYTDDLIPEYECINNTIVNMMRIIILWCFMAIIFSLAGFFLDIIAPRNNIYYFIRKYALTSTCTVLWVMAIISTCYYVAVLLEDSLTTLYPKSDAVISYGCGFYLVTATGAISLVGTFSALLVTHFSQTDPYSTEDSTGCLIDEYDEHIEAFTHTVPPPPYNIPPPPYAP